MRRNGLVPQQFMKAYRMPVLLAVLAASLSAAGQAADSLPAGYFRLLEAGSAHVERRMDDLPGAGLKKIEASPEWRHFPYATLAPTVLYATKHPANSRYHDATMLAQAIRSGDLPASEHEKGLYESRLDSDWDTYMWLEAYRLLEPDLGAQRGVAGVPVQSVCERAGGEDRTRSGGAAHGVAVEAGARAVLDPVGHSRFLFHLRGACDP